MVDKKEREAQLVKMYEQGVEAKQLKEFPIFDLVIKELEEELLDAVRNGKWFDFSNGINIGQKARDENCRRLQVLDDLVAIIENKMANGAEALKRLEANRNGSSKQR